MVLISCSYGVDIVFIWCSYRLHIVFISCSYRVHIVFISGACPEIRKRGGPKSESLFFFFFSIFQGGGPAPKIAEKRIFSTKKVAKYR